MKAAKTIASASTNSSRHLSWYYRGSGIFIKFPGQTTEIDTIFYVHPTITFKHVLMALNLPENAVGYPEGVGPSTPVMEFLDDYQEPKAVQLLLAGEPKFLRNKACSRSSLMALQVLRRPNSIYGYLAKYLASNSNLTTNISAQVNYFLIQFYLRLNGFIYCKLNNVNPNAILSPQLQHKISNFMVDSYDNRSPAAIKDLQEDKLKLLFKINALKQEIEDLQSLCQRRFGVYKWGAIAVTTAHILSFGYMIFWVEWLGWDIIEPLTYTVGVAYTLLGIRFYRKYKLDRTTDNIRGAILKQVINPLKMIQLKDLKKRLAIEEAHFNSLQARSRILKNRVNFKTSLCESLSSIVLV